MIKSFGDNATRDLFRQVKVRKQWRSFTRIARRKLDALHATHRFADLKGAGHSLEKLRGDRIRAVLDQDQRPMAGLLPLAEWRRL